MVKAVDFHLVENLQRVRQCLGHIGKDFVHLSPGLKPLLFRIEHARGIVEILSCGEAQQMIVGLSIFLVDEVCVVGADKFDAILTSQLDEHTVCLLLQGECLAIGSHVGVFHLMALQLQIIVITENTLVPLDGLTGTGDVTLQNLVRHLASYTGRTHDQSFVIAFQVGTVGARSHVETVNPRARDEFDQVLVALIVLRQHNQVIAALVFLAILFLFRPILSDIHLAAENGFEGLQAFLLPLFIDFDAIIMEFLDAEHVAVVGDGHTTHAIIDGFIDKP